jgi:hypothetical protein
MVPRLLPITLMSLKIRFCLVEDFVECLVEIGQYYLNIAAIFLGLHQLSHML